MPRIRSLLLLASAAVICGLTAAAVLTAQVRKCYLEVCSTSGGVTVCYEKEVECPKPEPE